MDSTGSQDEISKEEIRLNLMRTAVEAQDSSAKAIDDATLLRFLRARDYKVEKATQFFLKYLKWRRAFVPLGYIPESQVSNELEKKKIFIQGLDKQGRPIGVILAARHYPFDRDLEEFKRLVVYGFDKICGSLPRGHEKFMIIADLEGWGYRNSDIRGSLISIEMLQDFYPERLGKIIFVEDKHLKETLLKDIDESQLPEIYGGILPLVPAQDCIIPNFPPVITG